MGKWKFKNFDMPAAAANNPMAGTIKQLFSSASLEIKPDKKFTLTMVVPIEGTWSLNGNVISMQPTSVMGMSMDKVKEMQAKQPGGGGMMAKNVDQPMNATLSDDGKTLTLLGPTEQQGTLSFEKDSAGS